MLIKQKQWHFKLGDNEHTLALSHKILPTRVNVSLDGIVQRGHLLNSPQGMVYAFRVEDYAFKVMVRPTGFFSFDYDPAINGISLQSGAPLGSTIPPQRSISARTKRLIVLSVTAYLLGLLQRFDVPFAKEIFFVTAVFLVLFFLKRNFLSGKKNKLPQVRKPLG